MTPVTTDELIDKAAGAKAASIVLAQATSDREESRARGNRACDSCARGRDPRGERAGLRERIGAHRNRPPASHARTDCGDGARCRGRVAVGRPGRRTVRPRHDGRMASPFPRRRVPLGVVGVVYESRPNVTSDIAAICIKTGNAVVLRGGSEALASNRAIAAAIQAGLKEAGLPGDVGAVDHVYRPCARSADAEAA